VCSIFQDLYWQLVGEKDQHVSIQVAHIDTKHCGSAFPAKKDSPYARYIARLFDLVGNFL